MYKILQWTPFPNYFCLMPNWQLQQAESDLQLNTRVYHEHAILQCDGFYYPLDIAEKIVAYWSARYPFADFQLQGEKA